MKLTNGQAESFELLYSSVCNAIMYAEDLEKDARIRPAIKQFLLRLNWVRTNMELRIPADRRRIVRGQDHLFYDELLRCATNMTDEQKAKLEEFMNELAGEDK